MDVNERIARYAASEDGVRFPASIPRWDGRWMTGTWVMGQDYRATSRLYGAYPPRYLRRVYPLLPERDTHRTLHLFSGSLPASPRDIRVDRSAERPGDLRADASHLPLRDESVMVTLADPPYSRDDATRYGEPMPDRRRVLHEAARVTVSGGILVWLDVILPPFTKREWHWWGAITIIRSTNHRVRVATFFQRV